MDSIVVQALVYIQVADTIGDSRVIEWEEHGHRVMMRQVKGHLGRRSANHQSEFLRCKLVAGRWQVVNAGTFNINDLQHCDQASRELHHCIMQ